MRWGKLGKPLNDPPRKPDFDLEEDHFECPYCHKRNTFDSQILMHLRYCEKRPTNIGSPKMKEVVKLGK